MLRGMISSDTTRRALPGALLALALLALLAKDARAKTWEEWSPAPLASDSAFAALAVTPADVLEDSERRWFEVQRAWRAQREAEERKWSRGLSEVRAAHVERPDDERFAGLASRPPAALADAELEWLVAESAAQALAGEQSKSGSSAVGMVLLLGLVSTLAFALGVAYGIGHAFPN